ASPRPAAARPARPGPPGLGGAWRWRYRASVTASGRRGEKPTRCNGWAWYGFHPSIQGGDAAGERLVLHVGESVVPELRGQFLVIGELQHALGQITVRALPAARDQLPHQRQGVAEV